MLPLKLDFILLLSLILVFWRCINLGQMCSFLFNWFTMVLCIDDTVATIKFRSYDDSLGDLGVICVCNRRKENVKRCY